MPAHNPSDHLDSHAADLRFEAAWMAHRPGEPPPRWQDFLPAEQQPSSASLAFQLAQVDIEYRVKAGLPALPADDRPG